MNSDSPATCRFWRSCHSRSREATGGTWAAWAKPSAAEIEGRLLELAERLYEEKERQLGYEDMRRLERLVMLRAVDTLWVRHLTDLDNLREGIGLRAYGQQDPLVAFKKEAHEMYQDLLATIQRTIAGDIYRLTLAKEPQPPPMREVGPGLEGREARRPVKRKLGRNDPCWCGSGKKYKYCHMRQDMAQGGGAAAVQAPTGGAKPKKRRRRKRKRK